MPHDPIRFHFDFLSPYAYLAWTQVPALAARHGRRVEPVPTLLAALLAHGATKGPAEIPAKRIWVFKDTLRTAARLGVPFAPPPSHPFPPLLALRAVETVAGDARARLVDALFRAAWGGGGGVGSEDAVAGAATAAGLDGAAVVAAARGDDAKRRLREDTDAALALGVFGVPSLVVGREVFWGLDAFPHVEDHLAGRDPLTAEALARWIDLPATATRAGG